jgi:hypothetical protein
VEMKLRRMPAMLLWVSAGAALLGIALNVLPGYRNALGVVRSATDLSISVGPALVCAVMHAGCAILARRRQPPRGRIIVLCGIYDVVVGALMWVPWAGLWFSLFAPFGFVAFIAAYGSRGVQVLGYAAAATATLTTGIWIVVESVRSRGRPERALG